MTVAIAFLVGRIIVGIYYTFSGFNHFMNLGSMDQYAQAKGVPLPEISVVLTGILLLVGGITILLGYYPEIGVLSLVIFFIPVTFIMHNFWVETDAQAKMMQMVQFMKNMGLMGSALMLLAINKPWAYSVGKKS